MLDTIKLPLAAGVGALLVGSLVWGWATWLAIPAAHDAGFAAGEAHCHAQVAKTHAAELTRQAAANRAALDAARQREIELAAQAETLSDQLLDLANAITSDDSLTRLCLPAERVRDLNAIR